MRIFIITLVVLLSLLPPTITQATIIRVPADSSCIQCAINGAIDGDTVLVARGYYYERISFLGKAILVTSNFSFDNDTVTIDSTIIDANTSVLGITDTGSVVRFVSGEDSNSIIKGFTIQNGIGTGSPGTRFGGGIYCPGCSATITNNKIRDNSADVGGGGIFCRSDASPIIDSNIISDNRGSGIDSYLCNSLTITNNTICGNSAGMGAGIRLLFIDSASNRNITITNNTIRGDSATAGSGIYCEDTGPPSTLVIRNNVITGNSAGRGIYLNYSSPTITNNIINSNGGGIYCMNRSLPIITNNIISNNLGEGVACEDTSKPTIRYNDVWNNVYGNFSGCGTNLGILDRINVNGDSCDKYFNISYDPLFADTLYHLSWGSPCMEAGYNFAQGLLEFDFDGEPRVMDGDSNGIAIVDIGADEFPGKPPLCGDVNGDGLINVADVVFLINYLFVGGPKPVLLSTGDVNLDSVVNSADVVYLINYLFAGGPRPCQP